MKLNFPENQTVTARANFTALVLGLGFTPWGLLTARHFSLDINRPFGLWVLGPIMGLCAMAGAFAAGHPEIKAQGRSVATYQGGRAGARAGILTASPPRRQRDSDHSGDFEVSLLSGSELS